MGLYGHLPIDVVLKNLQEKEWSLCFPGSCKSAVKNMYEKVYFIMSDSENPGC